MRTRRTTKPTAAYIGIDMSITHPGVCVSVNRRTTCEAFNTPGPHKFPHRIIRFDHIADLVIERISHGLRTPNVFIMIEDYAFGAGGKTFEIAECCGILKWKLIHRVHVPPKRLLLVSTNHLKMFACGVGNAAKDVVIKECFKRWDFDTNDNDEADAFVLCQIAKGLAGVKEMTLTAYQKDILGRIREYNEPKKKKTTSKKK